VPDSTAAADEVSRGPLEHRHTRGTALAFCSQAPIDKIERYRAGRRRVELPVMVVLRP